MYDDLIKRLRNRRICIQQSGSLDDFPLLKEAADAIEDIANRMRWTLCKDKQPPNGKYLVYKRVYGSAYLYDVGTYAEDLSEIDEYDFPKEQYKGVGGWFDYDSETGYYQTNVFAWMPLLPEPPKEEN